MGVVLLGPTERLGRAVFDRLAGQGDEIRVLEDHPLAADAWEERGGFVALAGEWDADLIERASYGARTIVVFERNRGELPAVLEAVIKAAGPAGVDRLILLTGSVDVPPVLEAAGIDYVVLATGKQTLFTRSRLVPEQIVAEAVDAADDLPGSPRLAVDLTDRSSWSSIGLV